MVSLKSIAAQVLSPAALMHLSALDHYLNGERELRLLKRIVPRGKVAIDAGANIGTYSYFLSRLASGTCAYEPNPILAERLAKLMPSVRVRNVALSDKAGELVLRVPMDESGRSHHELGSVAQTFEGATREFRVPCVTIDGEQLDNVGFLKIDVEQHEREVIRGALSTIRASWPVLLVEVYPLKYERGLDEEFEFLTELGYRPWFKFDDEWFPLTSYRREVHARPENFGSADRFIGNNVIFFPADHRLAKCGPLKKE